MMTEIDIFSGCDLDEIMALVFDLEGPSGLQALLAQVDLDQEDLSQAASKMEQAGLIDGAEIIRVFSAKAETRASLEIKNILAAPQHNQKPSFASAYRRGTITLADLEAAGLDDDTLEYIERAKVIRKPRR